MKTLVLIPCYNEEENIEKVLSRLYTARPDVDCLVINDCSTDSSETILKAGGHRYISLPVNLGIGGGVQCGYQYAVAHGYSITVQMDGDGQHNPEYLDAVCSKIESGEADMCIGSRFLTKEGFQSSAMRRFGIKILSVLIQALCGKKVRDVTSGFRACGKELTAFYAANYAQDYPEPEAIVAALMNDFKITEAPVIMEERQGGVSSITTLRSAYYMVKVSLALIAYRLTFGPKKKRG